MIRAAPKGAASLLLHCRLDDGRIGRSFEFRCANWLARDVTRVFDEGRSLHRIESVSGLCRSYAEKYAKKICQGICRRADGRIAGYTT